MRYNGQQRIITFRHKTTTTTTTTNKTKTSQPNKNKTNKKAASFGRSLLAGEKRFKRQQSSTPDGVMDRVIGHGRRKGEIVF